MIEKGLAEKAGRVRLILMDVDGVLTDGGLFYLADGSEVKVFNVRDGAGIKLAQRAGIRTGIISGRESEAALRRAEELGMEEIHQQVEDKKATYEEIIGRLEVADEEVCFIGDDLVDLPVMRRVGLPAAPCDAHPSVLGYVSLVASRGGGRGAVREVIDLILQAKDKWREVTAPYV